MDSLVDHGVYCFELQISTDVEAGSWVTVRGYPFVNQMNNDYYQTIGFYIQNWVQKFIVTQTIDPKFRLRNFNTTPNIYVQGNSIALGTQTQYYIKVQTIVGAFKNSYLTYNLPINSIIQGFDCASSLSNSTYSNCSVISSTQVSVYINNNTGPCELMVSIPMVKNPDVINVTADNSIKFTSTDWEGAIIESASLPINFQCPKGCQVCNSTTCLTCLDDYYFNEGTCVIECPIMSYIELGSRLCSRDCTKGCAECSLAKTNCTRCSSNWFWFNSSCLSICPDNYTSINSICVSVQTVNLDQSNAHINQTTHKNHKNEVKFDTAGFPVFSIYTIFCLFLWILTWFFDKRSMTRTSLLALLSILEPLLYVYIVIISVLAHDYPISGIFGFIIAGKISLQAMFLTTDIRGVVIISAETELRKLPFLKILELCYNFKLAFLRGIRLFAIPSLYISQIAVKRVYFTTITPLKSALFIDMVTILGYSVYQVLMVIEHTLIKFAYTEAMIFVLLHALLEIAQIMKMKKELKTLPEASVMRAEPVTIRTQRNPVHIARAVPIVDTSMHKLNRTGDTKIELGKIVDESMLEVIMFPRSRNLDQSITFKENYEVEKKREESQHSNIYEERSTYFMILK